MESENLTLVLEAASPRPSFTVDGAEYALRFDLNATVALKKKTGINISRDGIDLHDAEMFRAALCCGLLHGLPNMTEEDAGALVDVDNIEEIRAKVFQAITGAYVRRVDGASEAPENPPSA